jgi:hypothetical protein
MSLIYSPTGPLVTGTRFLAYHGRAVQKAIKRQPSTFMRATAHALWIAYVARMFTDGKPTAYPAVSAGTGSGKSLAASALLAFLGEDGHSVAYVVESIEAVEEVRGWLEAMVPGKVAAGTSIHRVKAAFDKVRSYAEKGITTKHHFTEDEVLSAQIVVTTHDRWQRELKEGNHLGVQRRTVGADTIARTLVVVDEEPELQDTYVRSPTDVSALLSTLSSKAVRSDDEGRHLGFAEEHPAAAALLRVHDRMHAIEGNLNVPQLTGADTLVTSADLEEIETITREGLIQRLGAGQWSLIEHHWETVNFLKVASQGRVFHSKREGGAFHAYGFRLPVKPRHIILDGTADMNGLYAVGSHVVTVDTAKPDYSALKLFAVEPPKEFRNKMRPKGILESASRVKAYMRWLIPTIEQNTVAGEAILVYAKKAMLLFDVHVDAEFNDAKMPDGSKSEDRNCTTYKGRKIYWVNMGRGRGINRWKDCTVYFRLCDFHLPKDAATSSVGSVTNRKFAKDDLDLLSSPRSRHPAVSLVMETHLAVSNKQDAARTKMRELDDEGRCPPTRAYMIDCDLSVLIKYHDQMFPKAPPYELIGFAEKATSAERSVSSTDSAKRVSQLLLTTDGKQLSPGDVCNAAGISIGNYARTMQTNVVKEAMAARSWRETTRAALGMPGKGKLLIRD